MIKSKRLKPNNTGNKMRFEAARALSEALKVNTTLVTLNLGCVKPRQGIAKTLIHQSQLAGNDIPAQGVRALSEALKTNTTLQSLELYCDRECEDERIGDISYNPPKQAANDIRAEGTRELSETLKTNTTLQSLDLTCEQE